MNVLSYLGCAGAFTLVMAAAVHAGESKPIAWADLIDETTQTYEDPFRDLNYQQIDALQTIVRNRELLNDPTLSEAQMADSAAKINTTLAELAEDGIDADWLIDQRWLVADRREKAATAGNPALDGQIVTLSGFAVPAPPNEDGTTVVYLVPERGMCSPTPPPTAHQMIRARVAGDWNPTGLHQPVRLTGKLSVKETRHSFRIVDGEVPMRAGYVLDATEVETAPSFGSPPKATNGWAASIAEKLRASGQLPSQQKATTE